MKKYFFLVAVISFILITILQMNNNSIHIDDSYKVFPNLDEPTSRREIKFKVGITDVVSIKIFISYDRNDKNIRINSVEVIDINKNIASKVSININTTNANYESNEAIRITINMSCANLFNSNVGSSIIKLTQEGLLIPYTKTDNVSDIEIIE